MTLIDYPDKIACTFFVFGCNFKCGYCHNPELVIRKEIINDYSIEECLNFLKRKRKYLDGVCITGGEPLINPDIKDFLFKIKKMGYLIKIDTNGSNPDLLQEIILKGLVDYVAMDIKSDKEKYKQITQKDTNMENIEKSIKILTHSQIDYELRTTVVRGFHNFEIIKNIGIWINDITKIKPKRYVIQNFIPRKNKLIDKKFEDIEEFKDVELNEFKNLAEDYFEEVIIRN